MSEPMFNPEVPVSRTVYTAAKAVRAALVVAAVPVALFISAVADGNLSWDEVGEVIGTLLAVPAAYVTVYQTENKPKTPGA